MNNLSPEDRLRAAGGNITPATPGRPLPMRPIDPTTLECVPVPERRWIVHDWLGVGYVTGQYGDGGVGKGMTAQALQTATATGTPWLGRAVKPCRSIGIYCEDDDDELHRRQERLCRAHAIEYRDLGKMRWVSGVGSDNTFVTFAPDGKMTVTDRFHEFEDLAQRHRAELIILDNVADLYGGNENDRNQVRRFINVLNRLALDLGAAVLLNCHPSRSGLASGNLDGGSTAWSNSMRSRWTLAKAEDEDGVDSGERILSRAKANYAPDGSAIRLRWASGVLMPVSTSGTLSEAAARNEAERVFLLLLDRCKAQGQRLSDSRSATNYAPKLFAKRPDRDGYTIRDFERAMATLFADRKIRMEDYQNKGAVCRQMVRETETEEDAE